MANLVPSQPLHASIVQAAVLGPVSDAPLTYSVPACQARPATYCGEPARRTPRRCWTAKTPPFGGALLESLPPSPSKSVPSPRANEVGVCRPDATSVTVIPVVVFGDGGTPAPLAASASAAPARRMAAVSAAAMDRDTGTAFLARGAPR